MRTSSLQIAALAVALAAVSALVPGSAQAETFQVDAAIGSAYPTDRSYDALADTNHLGSGTFAASMTLESLLGLQGLRAYTQVDLTGLHTQRFGGDLAFQWHRSHFLLGADLGPNIGGFFRPFVRLTAGYARQRLEIDPVDQPGYSDLSHDVVTKNSLGFELFIPYQQEEAISIPEPFTFGITAETGYLLQTGASFESLGSERDDPWQRSGFDAGTLRTNAPFWDVGLFFRIDL